MRAALAVAALAVSVATPSMGCAGPASGLAGVAADAADVQETRRDLVKAFLRQGWRVTPVSMLPPDGLVGRGTVYHVSGRTVVVYDYATADEAAASGMDDARRIAWRNAGLSARVYLRSALVVVTYEPFGRTAFDLRLARLLRGPSLARA